MVGAFLRQSSRRLDFHLFARFDDTLFARASLCMATFLKLQLLQIVLDALNLI